MVVPHLRTSSDTGKQKDPLPGGSKLYGPIQTEVLTAKKGNTYCEVGTISLAPGVAPRVAEGVAENFQPLHPELVSSRRPAPDSRDNVPACQCGAASSIPKYCLAEFAAYQRPHQLC